MPLDFSVRRSSEYRPSIFGPFVSHKSRMYATSLPPRRNPLSRYSENCVPQFSSKELPLLPVNFISSWRTPPSKIWDQDEGDTSARPKTMEGYTRDSSARKAWISLHDSAINRLHAVQTHNISDRNIELGLIPPHLLDGSVPPAGKPITSLDFFPPSERLPFVPPINMGHQWRLIRKTPEDQLQAYKRGENPKEVPVRITKHTSRDQTHLKKSGHRNPRSISRNVLGGFYTS